jgi:hypothetical protein
VATCQGVTKSPRLQKVQVSVWSCGATLARSGMNSAKFGRCSIVARPSRKLESAATQTQQRCGSRMRTLDPNLDEGTKMIIAIIAEPAMANAAVAGVLRRLGC